MSQTGITINSLPSTVSNGLNVLQLVILNEIPQKASPKLRKSVRCSFRNVKQFQRSFWFFSWRIVWTWAHHNFAIIPALGKFLPRLPGTGCRAIKPVLLKIHSLRDVKHDVKNEQKWFKNKSLSPIRHVCTRVKIWLLMVRNFSTLRSIIVPWRTTPVSLHPIWPP